MQIGKRITSALRQAGEAMGLLPGEEPARRKDTYSVLDLHKSKTPKDLLDAHQSVLEWHLPHMEERDRYFRAMRASTAWSDDEKDELRRKKKPVVSFSAMKSSERAFLGNLLLQRYEIKPAPVEPSDQNLADVVGVLYTNTVHNNQCRYHDMSLLRNAWVGGNSWQESYVEIGPGRKPRIVTLNQNDFAIYPDPNRRDLVGNTDCAFIDRKGFFSVDDIVTRYPDKEDAIRAALSASTSITYQQARPWADRQHEGANERNGRFAVVERFYRVWRRRWDSVEMSGADAGRKRTVGYDLSTDAREQFGAQNPGLRLTMEPEEFLYLAVAVPGMDEYLHNGPYHAQPRNPRTGRIMFTLVELMDESLGGSPTGHVEHLIGPAKAVDAMAVNTLAAAKGTTGSTYIGDPRFFDERVRKDVDANMGEPNRTFWMKETQDRPAGGTALAPVQQHALTADTQRGLAFAQKALEENSSTPPSLKGYSEGNVPAALNEQRVQQASAQSMPSVLNYQLFLTNRALLWLCYWAEFWDFEDVVRVVEKSDPSGPDFITINQLVTDVWGRPMRRNDLSQLFRYDIVFEESWQSPSMREQTRAQLGKLIASSAVQADPVLNAFLQYYYLLLTDAPGDLKEKFLEHSQVLQKREAERQAGADTDAAINRTRGLQEIADREASATTPPTPPGPPAGMPPDMAADMALETAGAY